VLLGVVLRVAVLAVNLGAEDNALRCDPDLVRSRLLSDEAPTVHPIGFEYGSIAFALVDSDDGFASPFGGGAGPTAWSAPGPVLLYAAAFALFGSFTLGSVLALFAVGLAASAVITVLVHRIGFALFASPGIADIAALTFALLPHDVWLFKSEQIFDLNLFTLLFASLLLAGLRLLRRPTAGTAAGFGVLSGIAALFNPGFLICSVALAVIALWRVGQRDLVRLGGVIVVVISALVGPWIVLQRSRLGVWVPIRSNAPFELWLGNTRAASGLYTQQVLYRLHPSQDVDEYRRYRILGEVDYLRLKARMFSEEFEWHRFAAACGRRLLHYFVLYDPKPWDTGPWTIALKRLLWMFSAASLVAFALMRWRTAGRGDLMVFVHTFVYSLPYLVIAVMDRYRIPIVPAAAVCLAFVVHRIVTSIRRPTPGIPNAGGRITSG
jgi:hypothetical protein